MKQAFVAEIENRSQYVKYIKESQKRMENSQVANIFRLDLKLVYKHKKSYVKATLHDYLPDLTKFIPYLTVSGLTLWLFFSNIWLFLASVIGSVILLSFHQLKQTPFLIWAFKKGAKKHGIEPNIRILTDQEVLELI